MDITFCSLFHMFSEFVKTPAAPAPRATSIAPVNILVNVYALFTVYLNIKMSKVSMEKCLWSVQKILFEYIHELPPSTSCHSMTCRVGKVYFWLVKDASYWLIIYL